MKKILFQVLFLLIVSTYVLAQPTIKELNTTLAADYSSFDLSKWVSTNKDFNQKDLSVQDIDSKIVSIIKEQEQQNLAEIEVPINSKKLFYLGFIHPVKTNLFFEDETYFKYNDKSLKGDKSNIYKYENIYISTKSNTLLDRYLVYYTIRAYLIIKHRLPRIQNLLFDRTSKLPTNFIAQNSKVSFVNLTQNYFVTFDGEGLAPSNNAYFGSFQVGFTPNIYGMEIYPNTQVIYCNKNTILNGGATGNVPIYSNSTETTKIHAYMKDGFIHSIVHERIHDWIFQYQNLNKLADFLRKKAQSSGVVKNYYPFEESVVNNTTNILFEIEKNNGGLSNDVLNFYRKEFNISITKFKEDNSYTNLKNELLNFFTKNELSYKLSTIYNSSEDNRVFFINLLEKRNTPN